MAVDAEALIIRLEAQSEQLRREMRRAEQSVGNGSKKMERELNRINKSFDGINKAARTAQRAMGAFGVGLSLQGLRTMATSALRTADALQNTADRVSVNVEALQELRHAASQFGVQSGTLDMAMQRLTRRLGEAAQGSGTLLKTLEQYNIAVTDSQGRTRAAEDVLGDLADAIAGAESGAEQLRIAFSAFDSEGSVLVNMLRGGSRELRRYRHEARELGLVMNRDLVEGASATNTGMEILFGTIRTQIQQGFLEALVGQMGDLREIAADEDFQENLRTLGALITGLGQIMANDLTSLRNLFALFDDPSFENFRKLATEGGVVGLGRQVYESQHDELAQAERLLEINRELIEARKQLAEDPNRPGLVESVRQLEAEQKKLLATYDGTAEALMGGAKVLGTIRVTADGIKDTTSGTAKNVKQISEHEKAILAALEAATAARELHAERVADMLLDLERETELGAIRLRYLGDETGELEVQQRLYEIRRDLGEDAARQAEPYLRILQKQTKEIAAANDNMREQAAAFVRVTPETRAEAAEELAALFFGETAA